MKLAEIQLRINFYQDTMTPSQYFELLLGQTQPKQVFCKVIRNNDNTETSQVIYILANTLFKEYYKVYCKTIKDDFEIAQILLSRQYKFENLTLQLQNQKLYSYSKND